MVFYLATFGGKIYDILNRKQFISTNALRKTFNTVGESGALYLLKILVRTITLIKGFYGTVFFFCILSVLPSGFGRIAGICVGGIFLEIAYNGGFFISHSDLVGPYTSFLFGFTNTMANLTGFLNPLVMSAFLSEEVLIDPPDDNLANYELLFREPKKNGKTCFTSQPAY